MKVSIFFACLCLLVGCSQEQQDEVDLDQMVLLEDDFDQSSLAGDPLESPQEVMIKESPDVQY